MDYRFQSSFRDLQATGGSDNYRHIEANPQKNALIPPCYDTTHRTIISLLSDKKSMANVRSGLMDAPQTRKRKTPMNASRLTNYSRIAITPSVAGCSLVTGVVIATIPGQVTAGLQIWNVGQALPQISSSAPATQDLVLTATFNTAFQINLFGTRTSTNAGTDQVFWAPNNNLSFINYEGGNDPAIWMSTVVIRAGALDGRASNFGYTSHAFYQALNSHTTSHDIQNNINSGETGAIGIRFFAGSDFHYGWVEVSRDALGIVTVERWALESTAGDGAEYSPAGSTAVPGLGGLAALAIGAAGVRSRRQRTVA